MIDLPLAQTAPATITRACRYCLTAFVTYRAPGLALAHCSYRCAEAAARPPAQLEQENTR